MKPCRACGQERIAKNTELVVRGYPHELCSKCGSITVEVYLADDVVSSIYQEEAGYFGGSGTPRGSAVLWELAQTVNPEISRVLDVGCGGGHFLTFLPHEIDKYGCDVSVHLIKMAKASGLANVQVGTLSALRYPEGHFDFVNLGDVLEHVLDPWSMLAEARFILRRGGVLAIATPDMGSRWARRTLWLSRVVGIPPSVLTPPAHLTNFSSAAVKTMLEAQGFILSHQYSERGSLRYELIQVAISLGWPSVSFSSALRYLLSGAIVILLWGVESLQFSLAGRRGGKEARFVARKR